MALGRDGCSDLDSLLEKLNCRDQKEKNIFGFMRIFGYPNGQKILIALSSLVLVMVFFRLEWKAPEDNGGSQIVQYEVCRQQHCFQLVHFNIFISNTYLYFFLSLLTINHPGPRDSQTTFHHSHIK